MKSKLLALALSIGASIGASAAPTFSLNVPPGWDGSFSVKMVGYESFTGPIGVGSQNFGVLKVTSISDGGGLNTLWVDGQGGAEITGVFSGITVDFLSPTLFGVDVVSIGGSGSFFINPTGSLLAAGGFAQGMGGYAAAGGGCAVNQNCYNGISNVATGGSFIDVKWVSGVLDLSANSYTVVGDFNALTSPQSGDAQGFVDVVGGDYADTFVKDVFTFTNHDPADLRVNNTFCTPGSNCNASIADAGGLPSAGGWALRIDDPISGRFVVPEPGSLALVGFGMVGLAALRRRRTV